MNPPSTPTSTEVMSPATAPAVPRSRLRVAFAGTPEFARIALAALHDAGHAVVLVLSQPDRPAGRGMKLQACPVKHYAVAAGLPVAQPHSLRLDGKYPDEAAAAQAALATARPDVLVVAAYGLILPAWTLALPRLGCLNIHASLLPRWRGAAPIHRAIEAGDAETGVTIMQMDAGLDTGDMLLLERLPITAADTTARLHDRLAEQGGRLVVQALDLAAAGRLVPVRQPADGITYAEKISKAESALDWSLPAEVLARRVRALDPTPGCSFQRQAAAGAEVCKLWAAHPAELGDPAWPAGVAPAGARPGQVLSAGPNGVAVACGAGVLVLTELQRPGGKRLQVRDFLAGYPLAAGEQLG